MIITCPACNARFRLADDALGDKGRRLKCGRCQHSWRQLPPGQDTEDGTSPGRSSPGVTDPGEVHQGATEQGATTAADRRAPNPSLRAVGKRGPFPTTRDSLGPGLQGPRRPAPAAPDDLLSAQLGDSEADRRQRLKDDHEGRSAELQRRGRDQRLDLNPATRSSSAPLVVAWLLVLILLGGTLAGAWFFRDQVVAAIPEAARLYAALGIEAEAGRRDGLEIKDVLFQETTESGEPTLVVTGGVFNGSTSTQPVPTVLVRVTDVQGQILIEWRFRVATLSLPPGGSQPFETRHPYPNFDGPISVTVELQPPKR